MRSGRGFVSDAVGWEEGRGIGIGMYVHACLLVFFWFLYSHLISGICKSLGKGEV